MPRFLDQVHGNDAVDETGHSTHDVRVEFASPALSYARARPGVFFDDSVKQGVPVALVTANVRTGAAFLAAAL